MRRKKKDGRDMTSQLEEKVLDVNATMQGTLRFDDPVNLRISGKFEGTLDTKGKLMIGSKAEIRANITGETIHIEGSVNGNIKASGMLKLGGTAKLYGDIEVPRLIVDEGALLIGQVRMEDSGDTASGLTSTQNDILDTYQVADYLEVDRKKIDEWVTSGILPGIEKDGEWVFQKSKVDEWIAQGKIKG